jgi:hypothetical protein
MKRDSRFWMLDVYLGCHPVRIFVGDLRSDANDRCLILDSGWWQEIKNTELRKAYP